MPILIDIDGRVIDESMDIMLSALAHHDPEKWLMPEQGSVAEMLELIAEFDGGFKYHLDRYKYADRYEGTDAQTHRASGALYLARLNAKLSATTYLFGNYVALADRAIAPFVRQFARDRSNLLGRPVMAAFTSLVSSVCRLGNLHPCDAEIPKMGIRQCRGYFSCTAVIGSIARRLKQGRFDGDILIMAIPLPPHWIWGLKRLAARRPKG